MPLQGTSGAASQDAFGGSGVAVVPNYIEEVFSTYLYTSTGATQTITNGIDLAGKGGLVWSKDRVNAYDHYLFDTVRGLPTSNQALSSNTTGATGYSDLVQSFTSSGFTGTAGNNRSNVAWTFREQPKFFDIVTYSGDGVAGRAVPHNLNGEVGFAVVKRLDGGTNWEAQHRSLDLSANKGIYLNTTNALATHNNVWNSTHATSTDLILGPHSDVNGTGGTYVAYLWAHNAGGFGLAGTDNVISCGGFTADGASQAAVTLGYEPQWLLVKISSSTGSWLLVDNMRDLNANLGDQMLRPNSSAAESALGFFKINATGFTWSGADPSASYIYIAIRRGPMKVPTLGTSVFQPVTYTGNGTSQAVTTGITGDLTYIKYRTDAGAATIFTDRLRGSSQFLESNSTAAEDTSAQHLTSFNQLGFSVGNNGNVNASSGTFISETFKRAPGFFDEVCYTGTGVARTVTHNLAAVPELVIIKNRTSAYSWQVGALSRTFAKVLSLDQNSAEGSYSNVFDNTDPTASVFSVGTGVTTNGNTNALVAYLFATCAGVSKVGSYTGTGAAQTINCGFTAGSRFVLIKRTDSTGDWYVWDSARGIVSGNDSYLLLNSTAAEVTSTDYIDTYSAGFEISSTAPAAINANGGSFIFLAIS